MFVVHFALSHSHVMFHKNSGSPIQVVDGLKEELSVTQTKLNRLQHEADAKVFARAANNEGSRQGGVANKIPVSLEIKAPPVEQRSSGEVIIILMLNSILIIFFFSGNGPVRT